MAEEKKVINALEVKVINLPPEEKKKEDSIEAPEYQDDLTEEYIKEMIEDDEFE